MSHRFLLAGVLLIWGGSLAIADDPFAPTVSSPDHTADADPFSTPEQAPVNVPKAKKAPARIWIDSDPDRTKAVVTQLRTERVSGEILFDGNPLEEVLQRFETNHGIPVVLDRIDLEDLGLGPDEPIEARIPAGVPLSAALEMVLSPIECSYAVRCGVVSVSTSEGAMTPENLMVAIYPVVDLLHDGDYKPLIDLLTNSIDTDTWAYNGGPEGTEVEPYPQRGAIVVTQFIGVHDQIATVFAALRSNEIDPNAKPFVRFAKRASCWCGGGSGPVDADEEDEVESRSGGFGFGIGGGSFRIVTPKPVESRSAP